MLFTVATLAALTMLTANPEDALVGRWGTVKGQPRVLIDLQPNGLAQVVISAGIWTANERELRLVTPDKPDTAHAFPYSFDGEKLKVVLDRDPMMLERIEAPPEYRAPKAREQPRILSHGFVTAGPDVYARMDQDGGFLAISSSGWLHIPGASARDFEALAPGVGKDAKGVYCFLTTGGKPEPRRLEAADPKTFHVLGSIYGPYFADAKNVFTQCQRLVKRDPAGSKRLGSFDSKTFGLGPCDLLKDHTGLYAAVPLMSSSPDIAKILDHMIHSQLSVYALVSKDVDSITEQNCNQLPKPSPLTWDDLPPTQR